MKYLFLILALVSCASKPPPPESPASTKHSDTAPKTSVEAEQAAAEENAAFVTEIQFKKMSPSLTKAAQANLQKMLRDANKAGKVKEIKTVAWADSEYPSPETKKLSKNDENLAAQRNGSVKKFMTAKASGVKVEVYNMAVRPNAFQDWLSTSDVRIKRALETAGIPNTATSVKIPAKSGKAIVMAILEK